MGRLLSIVVAGVVLWIFDGCKVGCAVYPIEPHTHIRRVTILFTKKRSPDVAGKEVLPQVVASARSRVLCVCGWWV